MIFLTFIFYVFKGIADTSNNNVASAASETVIAVVIIMMLTFTFLVIYYFHSKPQRNNITIEFSVAYGGEESFASSLVEALLEFEVRVPKHS